MFQNVIHHAGMISLGLVVAAVCMGAKAPLTNTQLDVDHYGPVWFGKTTVGQASKLLNLKLKLAFKPYNPQCYFVSNEGKEDATLLFLVSRGTIMRVDISGADIPTKEGVRVGDSEKAVFNRYKTPYRVTKTPPYYPIEGEDDATVLEVQQNDRTKKKFKLLFESDGHRIRSIRAGRTPQIDYIEGCS